MNSITESTLEQTALAWFENLNYQTLKETVQCKV